jgi:putative chitinase
MTAILTLDSIKRLWPQGDRHVPGLIEGMAAAAPAVLAKYQIDTPLLLAHVMGQFSEETGAGADMVENINYTPARACQIWPSRFASIAQVYQKIGSYPGDPQFPVKLMDSVYGNRMGNRPGTHDGSTFIGRGLSQVTGREGYEKLAMATGLDLINSPGLINEPEHAFECGVADYCLCGCLPFGRVDDIIGETKHLNGGLIGLADRRAWVARWKRELGV